MAEDIARLLEPLHGPVEVRPGFEQELFEQLAAELRRVPTPSPVVDTRAVAPAEERRRLLGWLTWRPGSWQGWRVPAIAGALALALLAAAILVNPSATTRPEVDRRVAVPPREAAPPGLVDDARPPIDRGPAEPAADGDPAEALPPPVGDASRPAPDAPRRDRRPVEPRPGVPPAAPETGGPPSGASDPADDLDRLALAVRGEDGFWHIHTMNADGTDLIQLTFGAANDRAPAWSPDGTTIAFARESAPRATQVYLIDADGSNERLLVEGGSPEWSPDGTRIAYTVGDPQRPTDLLSVWIINIDGTGARRVTPEGLSADPAWSPTGDVLAMGGFFPNDPGPGFPDLYTMPLDGSSPPRRLTSSLYACNPQWSPDGTRLVTVVNEGKAFNIWTMNADGSDRRQLTDEPQANSYPHWSPDGRRIAFAIDPDVNAAWPDLTGVWVMDADGSNRRRVTPVGLDATDAAYAPRR